MNAGAAKPDLTVRIGGLVLRNPVLLASGTCGYGTEVAGLLDLGRIGGIVTKTITVSPRRGNPPPRVAETPSGMLNSIGLENVGLEAFIDEKVPVLEGLGTAVIVSVGGESVDDYARLVKSLGDWEVLEGVELNVSCPNVERGMAFGSDASLAAEVVAACRAEWNGALVVKLTPNAPDVAGVAAACERAGADAVTVANTFLGMRVDPASRRPLLSRGLGGLSGPAIRPLAVAKVWEVSRAVSIPVIGSGGVCTAGDALEHMIAGASAVQVGTATFIEPRAAEKVAEGIEEYCRREGVESVGEIVGSLRISEKDR